MITLQLEISEINDILYTLSKQSTELVSLANKIKQQGDPQVVNAGGSVSHDLKPLD